MDQSCSLQSFTKYLRQTLVFTWDSALWEKFDFCFFRRFLLVLTIFSSWEEDWALRNNSMKFRDFPEIFQVLSCLETCVYQFITNNHSLFHLLCKENLLNHQNVSNIINIIVDCCFLAVLSLQTYTCSRKLSF